MVIYLVLPVILLGVLNDSVTQLEHYLEGLVLLGTQISHFKQQFLFPEGQRDAEDAEYLDRQQKKKSKLGK